MLLWGINRLWVRLVSRQQEIAEVRQTELVVLLLCPFNHGSCLLGDDNLPIGPVWAAFWALAPFDLVVCVETLVGD